MYGCGWHHSLEQPRRPFDDVNAKIYARQQTERRQPEAHASGSNACSARALEREKETRGDTNERVSVKYIVSSMPYLLSRYNRKEAY